MLVLTAYYVILRMFFTGGDHNSEVTSEDMLVFRSCLPKYLRLNNATASAYFQVISVKHTASKQLWQNVRWGSTERVEGYSVVFQMVYMFNSFHITNLRVGKEKPHHGI